MALLTCDFFSEALQRGTSINVVLPQPTEEQIGVSSAVQLWPPRVLYLLHGLSDDHTAWVRYTSIERYATERGFAVVRPAVDRSFYATRRPGTPTGTTCRRSSRRSSAGSSTCRTNRPTPSWPGCRWAATEH